MLYALGQRKPFTELIVHKWIYSMLLVGYISSEL